jgi:hypothetical protein
MAVLRINPKLGLAENLRLNGIDPVNYVKDYSAAILPLYLNVTEGSGDISASTVIPATRGGSRYHTLRRTRRLKGGNQKKSRPILTTVCTIAIVVGLAALTYAAVEYGGAVVAIQAAAATLTESVSTCSRAALAKVAHDAAVHAAWTLHQGVTAQGVAAQHAQLAAEASCVAIGLAAKNAVTNLVVAQAKDQVIGAVGAAVAACGTGVLHFTKADDSKNFVEPPLRYKPLHLALDDAARGGGGPNNEDDELLFDTSHPDNIVAMMKAQAVFLAGEKMKATTARSILSLVGAAKSVTSIAGQKLPSEDSPTINAPKQGGGVPEVSYIEMRNTLGLIGVLPEVIDEILANSSNPSLSEKVNTNKSA